MITVTSFGVIPLRKQGKGWQVLLILHRKGNHWGFPKGRSNPGEEPKQAAERELNEEVGLKASKWLSETPLMEQYQFRHKRDAILKIVHYFPALVEGALTLQEKEIREAQWLFIEEALEKLSFKEARHLLEECMKLPRVQHEM